MFSQVLTYRFLFVMQNKNLSNSYTNNMPWTWLCSASVVLYILCSIYKK